MTRTTFAAVMLCAVIGTAAQLRAQSPAPAPAVTPTFSHDVAPIFYKSCTGCHRPGEIGPMALVTYQDARPWAKSIAVKVASGAMPPWHADPSHGEFLNDRRLADADKETILKWANGGAPEGNPNDLPPAPKYADGWQIGQPDVIFALTEDYPVPASGTIEYKYFEVPTNFTEDQWVQAFEVRPGDRSVVHHVIVFAKPPGLVAAHHDLMTAQLAQTLVWRSLVNARVDADPELWKAVVGGVAGHYVGSGHGMLGAAAGCLVGRHYAKKHARQQMQQQNGQTY